VDIAFNEHQKYNAIRETVFSSNNKFKAALTWNVALPCLGIDGFFDPWLLYLVKLFGFPSLGLFTFSIQFLTKNLINFYVFALIY
jgi:hypothetical protein